MRRTLEALDRARELLVEAIRAEQQGRELEQVRHALDEAIENVHGYRRRLRHRGASPVGSSSE
jgi:acyl-CoA reductase-like NAD-dependent aldehyde dehydrogenase